MDSSSFANLDPRAQRTRAKIIHALQELVLEGGMEAVTHQTVAERAGVGRATVYRHFPDSKSFLWAVLEVIDVRQQASIAFGSQTSAPKAIFTFMRWLADRFSDPLVRALFLTVALRAQHDEDAAQIPQFRLDQIDEIVRLLATRYFPDQWATQEERSDLVAMLMGPVILRTAILREPATDEFLHLVIENTLGDLMHEERS